MTQDEAIAVLLEMVKYGEIHTRDCESCMGPPGPFPCNCNANEIILVALDKGSS